MKFFCFTALALSLLLIAGCMSNVEDVSQPPDIDPSQVSYNQDIQPIFNNSCGGGGCHINNTTNGVHLASYSATTNSVGSTYGEAIIIPGKPGESPLVDKIEPNPRNGARMPQGGPFLTNTEISQIKAWIEGGAENN